MKHSASPEFWAAYRALPSQVQQLADRCFELLRVNRNHPSLHFKSVGRFWSVRVGLHKAAILAGDSSLADTPALMTEFLVRIARAIAPHARFCVAAPHDELAARSLISRA